MSELLDKNEVIKNNPNVDDTQLSDVVEALKSLRNAGIARSGYNIAAPFSRRPTRTPEQDPRAVHVRR